MLQHLHGSWPGAKEIVVLRQFEIAVALMIAVGLPLVLLLQMTDRFVFGGSLQLAWTEEVARILMVWLTFWGAALVQREDSHIRLELVHPYLFPVVRASLSIVIDIAILGFLIVIVIAGSFYARHEWGLALPATGFPRSVLVVAVVVGSLLMALHLVYQIVQKSRELFATRGR
jgi:TRAP-type C4-dicarboxylate transport system permease small subunit